MKSRIKITVDTISQCLKACVNNKDFLKYFLIFDKNLKKRLMPVKKHIKMRDREKYDFFMASCSDLTVVWDDMMDLYVTHNYPYRSLLYNDKVCLAPVSVQFDKLDSMFYSHNYVGIKFGDNYSIDELTKDYLFVHQLINNFLKKYPNHIDFVQKYFIIDPSNSKKPLVFKNTNLVYLLLCCDRIKYNGIESGYDHIIGILKEIFIKLHYKYLEGEVWRKYSKKEISTEFLKTHISEIDKEILKLEDIFENNNYEPFSKVRFPCDIDKCFGDSFQRLYGFSCKSLKGAGEWS